MIDNPYNYNYYTYNKNQYTKHAYNTTNGYHTLDSEIDSVFTV